LPHQDRLNIAVFIDFDNIEIGVKSTLGQQFDVGTILDAIKERGEVVTKIAYADWTRAGEYSRTLTQHAIRLVQRNLTPGGDKNGADINLALDALEMAFTHPHINAYVIVGGDSDFLSLVEKLKQYDKKVFVVGGRAFTSVILQRNCHEFIAYENLAGVRKQSVKEGRPMAPPASLPIAQAFPIVRRALKILADREVSPQTGLLKSTLLQLDSTFSERNYGASSFLDFVEKLSHPGLVQLKHSGRSVMVELNDGFEDGDAATVDQRGRTTAGVEAAVDHGSAAPRPPTPIPAQSTDEVRAGVGPLPERRDGEIRGAEPAADGVKRVAEALHAATGARWPMYLRNVKQLLRAADAAFDERQYGFSGLVELVRACQKEGLVRLERDRRGGLRVFPGPALQRATIATAPPADAPESAPAQPVETASVAALAALEETREAIEQELVDNEPMPTSDPTAELLGTTKRKRASRSPSPVQGAARGGRQAARKTPARKTLATVTVSRRGSRPKKDAAEKSDV
jgi:uncharacterized LabA/DUF88 family protein